MLELTDVAIHRLHIPLRKSFETSHGAKSSVPTTLCVLRTSEGAYGIGTSDPSSSSSYYSTPEETVDDLRDGIAPALLDAQPSNPNALRSVLTDAGTVREAQLAAEMAYLDLYGKQTGQSISAMLGGRLRATEPLNGWVGIHDPKTMASMAEEMRDVGFTGLKIKLSGEVDDDLDRVRAVCEAVGQDMQVRADANTAFDVSSAIELAKAMEELPVTHFEQPIDGDDIDGLRRITASTSTTIMSDEAVTDLPSLLDVLDARAADRIKLKIMRLGGIARTDLAIRIAEIRGIECVVGHGYCTLPGASAEAQVTAANGNVFRPIETVGSHKIADEPFTSVHDIDEHSMRLGDAPGLGVELEEERLDDFVEETHRIGI